MRTVCITGSAGGIGAATRQRLEKEGARVIGVDVRDAEVVADLSTPDGRDAIANNSKADLFLSLHVNGAFITG